MGCARLFFQVDGLTGFHKNWSSKVIFLTYSLLVQTGQRREVRQIPACATFVGKLLPETFSMQNC